MPERRNNTRCAGMGEDNKALPLRVKWDGQWRREDKQDAAAATTRAKSFLPSSSVPANICTN